MVKIQYKIIVLSGLIFNNDNFTIEQAGHFHKESIPQGPASGIKRVLTSWSWQERREFQKSFKNSFEIEKCIFYNVANSMLEDFTTFEKTLGDFQL